MTTAVAKQQSFEEKMKDRIRESIGDLLTDEDLYKLIEKGIQEAFFTETTVQEGWKTTTKPSLMTGILKEVLVQQVREAVNRWLIEHKDEVQKMLDEALMKGVGKLVEEAISSWFHTSMMNLKFDIEQRLMNQP